jgi:peptidoglycan/LPS O-acetylase OafA/YrhL
VKRGKANYGLIYFHRYYRVLPAVVILMGFAMFFFPRLGSGPQWADNVQLLKTPCYTNWWANLFFIENIYPYTMTDECLGWVWYLANDM